MHTEYDELTDTNRQKREHFSLSGLRENKKKGAKNIHTVALCFSEGMRLKFVIDSVSNNQYNFWLDCNSTAADVDTNERLTFCQSDYFPNKYR